MNADMMALLFIGFLIAVFSVSRLAQREDNPARQKLPLKDENITQERIGEAVRRVSEWTQTNSGTLLAYGK